MRSSTDSRNRSTNYMPKRMKLKKSILKLVTNSKYNVTTSLTLNGCMIKKRESRIWLLKEKSIKKHAKSNYKSYLILMKKKLARVINS